MTNSDKSEYPMSSFAGQTVKAIGKSGKIYTILYSDLYNYKIILGSKVLDFPETQEAIIDMKLKDDDE